MSIMTEPRQVEALAALDHEAFQEMVSASLNRDAPPELWEALAGDRLRPRTKAALTALKVDVQGQMTVANAALQAAGGPGRTAEFRAAKAEQAQWRRSAAHFQRLVDRRLSELKAREPAVAQPSQPQVQSPYGPDGTKQARKHMRAALETLARAVAAHREAVESGDGGPEDDDALWARLDTITAVAQGEEMPLTRWLEYLDRLREEDERAEL